MCVRSKDANSINILFVSLCFSSINTDAAFVKFLGDESVRHLTSKVGFVHINAPGQEPNAEDLPDK